MSMRQSLINASCGSRRRLASEMFQSRESTQSRDRCKSVVSAKHVLQVVNPQIQARVLLPWTEFLANILPVLTTHHHQNQVSADLLSISCGPSIMSIRDNIPAFITVATSSEKAALRREIIKTTP